MKKQCSKSTVSLVLPTVSQDVDFSFLVYIHMCVCVSLSLCMYLGVCVCVCIYICVFAHVYMCMCVCVLVHMCVYVHVCVCVYICLYMYLLYVCICVCLARQTQIETREFCELLYIEAAHIQRIYKSHQDVMDGLLRAGATSGLSTSPEPDDASDGTGKDSMERVSELAMAGWTLHQLIKDHFKELIRYTAETMVVDGVCAGMKRKQGPQP